MIFTKEDQGDVRMKLAELQAELRHFAEEREWGSLLTPKNMSTALMVAAADMARVYQWMTPAASGLAHQRPATRQRIAEAVADMLLYLSHIADQSGIDMQEAVRAKLSAHALKYPVKQRVARGAVARAMMPGRHVLLDYENVQPSADELRAIVPGASQVWVFHGPHQKQIEQRFESLGDDFTLVPISKTGKNALDFHLSFYMGYIASRSPEAEFVVVSNDKGYEPVLEHAKTLGFAVRQQGHAQPVALKKTKTVSPVKAVAAKKAPVKKPVPAKKIAAKQLAPVKKVAVKKTAAAPVAKKKVAAKKVATKSPGKTAAPLPTARGTALPSAPRARAGLLQKVTDNLRKMGSKRPVKSASLRRTLKSFLGADAADQSIETLFGLLVAAGTVSETKQEISYPGLQ
ncbi:PIN domain-containing protein [Roseateles sp. BYS96W]|uniref:PIN domain-containing protein n=1 Tax=Pelomonas nitida TaxID=3299027 RepID=A0ABW7G9Q1_9BURK